MIHTFYQGTFHTAPGATSWTKVYRHKSEAQEALTALVDFHNTAAPAFLARGAHVVPVLYLEDGQDFYLISVSTESTNLAHLVPEDE